MRCPTCANSGKPGYVPAVMEASSRGVRVLHWRPCPDCQGDGTAHCCDGLRAQPEPAERG